MNGTNVNDESDLHNQLIEYATASCRLLFIQNASVFEEFQTTNELNDLSTLELNTIMLNDVLPKIFSYQLTAAAKKQLKFLDMHPDFRRTDQGYQYEPQHLQQVSYVLKSKTDFSPGEQLSELLSEQLSRRADMEFRLNGPDQNRDLSHTMLVETDSVPQPKFQLSLDIAALISAILSTDQELSSGQLHNLDEINRRLRCAKESFEDRARILPYRKDLDQVMSCKIIFEKLKKSFCTVLRSL